MTEANGPTAGMDDNQPLRASVDAIFSAQRRALDQENSERDRAIAALREALEAQARAGDEKITVEVAAVKELLGRELEALEKQTQQYQEQEKYALEVASRERENAAAALREQENRAQVQADSEREKSAQIARDSLNSKIDSSFANLDNKIASGYDRLELHIRANKTQSDAEREAAEKATELSNARNEKRFDGLTSAVAELRVLSSEQAQRFVLAQVYDQAQVDSRRRDEAMTDLIQSALNQITSIQARGGGEKDHAADLKSTLAVGVAVIAILVSGALGLLSQLG